jgi:hypothetical protein
MYGVPFGLRLLNDGFLVSFLLLLVLLLHVCLLHDEGLSERSRYQYSK